MHEFHFCHTNGKEIQNPKKNDWLSGRLVHRLNSWWWRRTTPSKSSCFVPEASQDSLLKIGEIWLVEQTDVQLSTHTNDEYRFLTSEPGNLHTSKLKSAVNKYHQEYGHTYTILIFDADISSICNEAYHCVVMASCSCSVRGSPLIEKIIRQWLNIWLKLRWLISLMDYGNK